MYSDFSAVEQVVAAGCLLTLKNSLLMFCVSVKVILKMPHLYYFGISGPWKKKQPYFWNNHFFLL